MKTIYRTFSPIPHKLHPNWKDAEVRSAIRFTVDDVPYTMLNNDGRFSVFDRDGKRLIVTSRVTDELGPFMADLFSFRLQLQSKESEQTQATPAFLFLPFYVDQDIGWAKNWSSFTRLDQFTTWKRDVAEFHMGVRPNEFYQAKSGLARVRADLKKLQDRREVLQGVLKRLMEELAKINFDIDIESYQKEIEALLVFCNRLQKKEEDLKGELARAYNTRAVVESQVAVTRATARELKHDYQYATEKIPENEIECPLCGTIHQNSFVERFEIARDEQRCDELLVELRTEASALDDEIAGVKKKYAATAAELEESRALLNQKQGEITLRQVIEREGKKEARVFVQRDIEEVNGSINHIGAETRRLEERMGMFDNRERRADIQRAYVGRMKRSLAAVDVLNLPERRYRALDASIPESGSDLPRALLAYYFSVLNTIAENQSATFCPIVVDSPKQQDPDPANWLRILNYIRDNQPRDSQLILSLVDDAGIDFGGDVIDLVDKYSVLNAEQFGAVADEMMPLIARSEDENTLF